MNALPMIEQLEAEQRAIGKAIAALRALQHPEALTVDAQDGLEKHEPRQGGGRRPKPRPFHPPVECGACGKAAKWNPCDKCGAVLAAEPVPR